MRSWFGLLLIVSSSASFVASTAHSAHGQPEESANSQHIRVPFPSAGPEDFKAKLARHQRSGIESQAVQKFIEDFVKHPDRYKLPKDHQQALKQLAPNGKLLLDVADPAIQALFKDLMKMRQSDGTAATLKAEERNQLDETLKKLQQLTGTSSPSPSEPSTSGQTTRPADSDKQPPNLSSEPATEPTDRGPDQAAHEADPMPTENQEWNEMLRDWAEKVQSSEGLRNSAALRDTIRGLGQLLETGNSSGNHPGHFQLPKPPRYLPSVPASWRPSIGGLSSRFGSFPKIPKLPHVSLPSVSMPKLQRMPSLSAPSIHVPRLPTQHGSIGNSSLLAVVVGLIALAAVLWIVWSQWQHTPMRAHAHVAKLGPWPVSPGRVSTPEELMAAFEYLALLRLGPPARPRNHHVLASDLGSDDEARRRAAAELAELYEQARYAPNAVLPADAYRTAQRNLSFLAGVPAS